VLGRSDVDWHERQQLDFSYAHSWSLATDLRILAETVPAVLRRSGAH
jgi:lipopolysaccharide/colanic/teichoic acid biosynthesis glycosyltransferase